MITIFELIWLPNGVRESLGRLPASPLPCNYVLRAFYNRQGDALPSDAQSASAPRGECAFGAVHALLLRPGRRSGWFLWRGAGLAPGVLLSPETRLCFVKGDGQGPAECQ